MTTPNGVSPETRPRRRLGRALDWMVDGVRHHTGPVIGAAAAFIATSAGLLLGLGLIQSDEPPRVPSYVTGVMDGGPVYVNGQRIDDPSPELIRELLGIDAVTPAQEAEADGLLSGTWSMWWTNSLGDESVAFTIRFVGVDSGTVEILNDETETETSFAVDDADVSFRFTRLMSVPGEREVREQSKWEGTVNSSGEIEGAWYREDWSCEPPPGDCTIGPGFEGFYSRLVRDD